VLRCDEQTGLFDPSAMKKKKKKPKAESVASADVGAAPVEELEKMTVSDPSAAQNSDHPNDDSASGANKYAALAAELLEDSDAAAPVIVDIPVVNFSGKKRPRKVVDFGDEDELFSWILREVSGVESVDAAGIGLTGASGADGIKKQRIPLPWEGSDRDYTYNELLRRAFELMHGKNSGDTSEGEGRKRFRLRAPQVAREGSKKTVFMNFGDICKSIHRQPDHLLAYLGAELGTTGNLQEGGRLVIKGKFQPKGIENVLRRYITEYVICSSCMSPDTVLMRDANTRLYFLQCESCGASRSVAPIRQGFMAQVTRRKK